MGEGFQFIDIVFFAMIAAFLVLRLRSVLGRRDGHEGGHPDPFRRPAPSAQTRPDRADEKIISLPGRARGDDDAASGKETAGDATSVALAEIERADPTFSPQQFGEGAKAAFEMILGAYKSGDVATLKKMLSAEVYSNFLGAIRIREKAGETLEDTLVGIKNAEIAEATADIPTATVTVKFVSEQIHATRDEKGDIVSGDASAVTEVTDFWTFSRDTQSRDPNWTLVATRSLD
ncbi:MAG: Tim44 domain-containing protein [Rhodospirillales bacterium]|nr:Tim44 domain-containing protein [Rhodospirillales bacterium]